VSATLTDAQRIAAEVARNEDRRLEVVGAIPAARQTSDFDRLVPSLEAQLGDLACEAREIAFHAVPVAVRLRVGDALIRLLGTLPARGRNLAVDAERSNFSGADERLFKKWLGHGVRRPTVVQTGVSCR